MRLPSWKPDYDLLEIHQYTLDLERITMLRDKCDNEAEKAEYDNIIKCMQLVLQELHKQS